MEHLHGTYGEILAIGTTSLLKQARGSGSSVTIGCSFQVEDGLSGLTVSCVTV